MQEEKIVFLPHTETHTYRLMALGLGVCEGGTREQCSGNSHNAISSKRVAACPSFSQGTNACFFKQPNCDIFIEFSVLHLVSRVWQRTSTTKHSQFGLLTACFFSSSNHIPACIHPPKHIFHFLIFFVAILFLHLPGISHFFFPLFPIIIFCLGEL